MNYKIGILILGLLVGILLISLAVDFEKKKENNDSVVPLKATGSIFIVISVISLFVVLFFRGEEFLDSRELL